MNDRELSHQTVEEQLAQKYGPVGIREGGDLLLRHTDALRYLEDCEKLGQVLLGLDLWIDEHSEIPGPGWSEITEGPDASIKTVSEARILINDGLPYGANFVSFVLK